MHPGMLFVTEYKQHQGISFQYLPFMFTKHL